MTNQIGFFQKFYQITRSIDTNGKMIKSKKQTPVTLKSLLMYNGNIYNIYTIGSKKIEVIFDIYQF